MAVSEVKEVKTEVDTVQVDLKRLRDDVAALTQTIAALTAQQASRGLGAAHDAGEKVAETVQRAGEELKRASSEGVATLEQKITERPLSAVLIALGVGLLLGKLTDRR